MSHSAISTAAIAGLVAATWCQVPTMLIRFMIRSMLNTVSPSTSGSIARSTASMMSALGYAAASPIPTRPSSVSTSSRTLTIPVRSPKAHASARVKGTATGVARSRVMRMCSFRSDRSGWNDDGIAGDRGEELATLRGDQHRVGEDVIGRFLAEQPGEDMERHAGLHLPGAVRAKADDSRAADPARRETHADLVNAVVAAGAAPLPGGG